MVNKTTPTLSTRERRCSKNLKPNSGTAEPKKVIIYPKEKAKTVEKREVRSRNAKSKAALEILCSSTTTIEPTENVKKAVHRHNGKYKTITEKSKQSPTKVSLTPTEQKLMNGRSSSINSFQAQADFIRKSSSNPSRKPMYVVIVLSDLKIKIYRYS